MMGISGTFLANETRLASHKRKVHLARLPWRFLGEGEAEVSLIGEGEYIRSARVRIRRRLPIDLSYIDRRHLILLGYADVGKSDFLESSDRRPQATPPTSLAPARGATGSPVPGLTISIVRSSFTTMPSRVTVSKAMMPRSAVPKAL
ncbi:hypothetical protein ACVWXM_007006 [Bradyrhizobium sp. GM7.3]